MGEFTGGTRCRFSDKIHNIFDTVEIRTKEPSFNKNLQPDIVYIDFKN